MHYFLNLLSYHFGFLVFITLAGCATNTPTTPENTTAASTANVVEDDFVTNAKDTPKPPRVTAQAAAPRRQRPPTPNASGYAQEGMARWYSLSEHGARTAGGEVYDLYGMTAAHASLPLFSRVMVTNPTTGDEVIVTVNDRLSGEGTLIKLSFWAARRLGLVESSDNYWVEVRGLPPLMASRRNQPYTSIAMTEPPVTTSPKPRPSPPIPAMSKVKPLPPKPVTTTPRPPIPVVKVEPPPKVEKPTATEPDEEPCVEDEPCVTAQPIPIAEATLPVNTKPTATLPPIATTPLTSGFYIQIGSFLNLNRAQVYLSQMTAMVNRSGIIQPKANFYRALIGPLRDESEAQEVEELVLQYGADVRVLKI